MAVADPRRPRHRDGRAPRALRARRPRRAAVDEDESDESYSDASEDARRALELRAAASSSEDEDSSSDDDGPLRLRSTEAIADDGTDDALRARLENIEESDDDDGDALRLPGGFVLRASISSRLYAHQRRAVGWLWDLWRQREGGVVGDEMGLGKTAQVAAFLGAVADKQECRTCLSWRRRRCSRTGARTGDLGAARESSGLTSERGGLR